MNTLLISPRFPTTYWGMQHSLAIIGKRATIPPLGLISVAALLPATWDQRLVDLNIEPLTDADILWADVVLIGGMRIQAPSIHEVIGRAARLGRPTVLGGPAVTTAPDEYSDADVRFLGEAEQLAERLLAAIVDPRPGTIIDATERRPELSEVPAPRFDLLDRKAYTTMSVQYSRGCPFQCEFCDIIEIFGRRPRVKPVDRLLAELDALFAEGHRGPVFIVDDNFIGNKPAVKKLLVALRQWQRDRGFPFDFFTEASLNLAADEPLMTAMVDAGFSAVFVGLESPSTASLAGAGKGQNLKGDMAASIERITRSGLEVMGGFIVGFDQDDENIFEAQQQLIQASPISLAMVGLLMALPGTALTRRLSIEGRLRKEASGDQFGRPNFEPRMDEVGLLRGYARVMRELYTPAAYYARCARYLDSMPAGVTRGHVSVGEVVIFLRTIVHIGMRSPQRWRYWRLLARAAWRRPRRFARAVAQAVQGEHMIRYTNEELLPRIEEAIAEVERERAARGARAADTIGLVARRGSVSDGRARLPQVAFVPDVGQCSRADA